VGTVTDVSEVHALSVFRVEVTVHVLIRLSLTDAREGSACSRPSDTKMLPKWPVLGPSHAVFITSPRPLFLKTQDRAPAPALPSWACCAKSMCMSTDSHYSDPKDGSGMHLRNIGTHIHTAQGKHIKINTERINLISKLTMNAPNSTC
jgi:hypothetical protein